jgi:maltose alpha-D-glucosyltransferase/alpha-amylase
MLDNIRQGAELRTDEGGRIRFTGGSALADEPDVEAGEVRRLGTEQSNTSIAFGTSMILKLIRRLQPGIHPEIEMGRFLTEVAGFKNTPALLGSVEHIAGSGGTRTALAVLQRFVGNQGDAWSWTLDALKRELDSLALVPEEGRAGLEEIFATYLPYAEIMGRRTAELHLALATPTDDPAFRMEPLAEKDVTAVADDARKQASRAFAALKRQADTAPEGAQDLIRALQERQDECLALIERLTVAPEGAQKIRIHGDYHLGQVLIVENDVMIVDFEGEPSRRASERRAKGAPLRDVAGMLRSFDYAAATAAKDTAQRFSEAELQRITDAAMGWRALTSAAFLRAYEEAVRGSPVWIGDAAARRDLLRLHLLAKALYEINYEANNRPDWIETPVRGVLAILDEAAGEGA